MANQLSEYSPSKINKVQKVWANPELTLISKGYLEGGPSAGAHEAHFTPKHTHYNTNGGGTLPVTTGRFNNYVS